MSIPKRVLFVCRANRFRSPLAAALFRRMVAQEPLLAKLNIEVRSAGPDAERGVLPSDIAFRYARELGVDISNHRATPLADAVAWPPEIAVCMERGQRDMVRDLVPNLPVYLLPWFATRDHDRQMTEPFPRGTPTPWPPGTEELFKKSVEEIEQYLPAMVSWLKGQVTLEKKTLKK